MSRRDDSGYDKLPHRRTDYGPGPKRRSSAEIPAGRPADAPPSSLEQFRAPLRRARIHPLEQALLWVVAAHLVFLPWAIGGADPWAQWVSLVASAISIGLALAPRDYTEEHSATGEFRLIPLPKLLKFPIFWLGLVLLALVTIQALNPAWEYQANGKVWWMRAVPHITWLPTGVRVPFQRWGPWRMLLIYASGWLTVCAIWVGFTRRRTVQRLMMVLAGNGAALAIFGLAERMFGATKIFWFVDSPNPSFFASFIYKNHAGAYLNLALAATCGLCAWFYLRGVRRLEKSNPSGVFAFLATCISVSVLVSYARGATLVMLAYLCIFVAAFIYNQVRLPKEARSPVVMIALLIIFSFFLKTGLDALHSDLAWDRLRQALSGEDVSVEARQVANRASGEMLNANWKMGVGSGGFRFLFPVYQQHHPEIAVRQYWEHAHNDVLEIPIELGVPGVLLIAGAFAFWALALVRAYAWQNPLSASVILGCLFMIGMSWGEFVFQNPAILITWCAFWPAATIWAQLEEQRGR